MRWECRWPWRENEIRALNDELWVRREGGKVMVASNVVALNRSRILKLDTAVAAFSPRRDACAQAEILSFDGYQ